MQKSCIVFKFGPFRYRSIYPWRVKYSMAAKHKEMGTWVSSLLAARGSFMKAILPMGSAWGSRTLTVTGSRFSRKAKNLTWGRRRNHKFRFDFLFLSRPRPVKGFLSGWERPLLTSILPQMPNQELRRIPSASITASGNVVCNVFHVIWTS